MYHADAHTSTQEQPSETTASLPSLDPAQVIVQYGANGHPVCMSGWLEVEPMRPVTKTSVRAWEDCDSDDEAEDEKKMQEYAVLYAAWQEQHLQSRRPVLLGRHGRPHDQTIPDGMPGEHGGRPFDNICDAPQIQLPDTYTMPMPDYTAANIVRLAATTNCTPDDVVSRIVSTKTLVSYAFAPAGLNLVMYAQPLVRMGRPAVRKWRGGGLNGSDQSQEPVRWW